MDHVYTCPHPKHREFWRSTLLEFEKFLEDIRTSPQVKKAILFGLSQWQNGSVGPPPKLSRAISLVVLRQSLFGWRRLLDGQVLAAWGDLQQQYFVRTQLHHSGHRWLVQLIKRLWRIAWDSWRVRNELVHDLQEGRDAVIRHTAMAAQLSFGCRDLPRSFHPTFQQGLPALLQRTPPQQKLWLARVIAARARYDSLAVSSPYAQERQTLAAWLSSN